MLVSLHDVKERADRGHLSEEQQALVDLLYLSDTLAHRFGGGFRSYYRDVEVPPGLLERLKLDSAFLLTALNNAKHFIETFYSTVWSPNG